MSLVNLFLSFFTPPLLRGFIKVTSVRVTFFLRKSIELILIIFFLPFNED